MEVMIYDTTEEAIAALREDKDWIVAPHELEAMHRSHGQKNGYSIPAHIRDQY